MAGLCSFQWVLLGALPHTPTLAHEPPPLLTPLMFSASKEQLKKPLGRILLKGETFGLGDKEKA